jgi:hypothetical protein
MLQINGLGRTVTKLRYEGPLKALVVLTCIMTAACNDPPKPAADSKRMEIAMAKVAADQARADVASKAEFAESIR